MKYFLLKILMIVLISITSSCSIIKTFSDQSLSARDSFSDKNSTAEVTDSKEANIALNTALLAIKLQDIGTADKAFKAMLLAGAKSPVALNRYAVFLREQWRMEEAEAMYLKALKVSPNNAMTHWNLAIFYELYRGDYKQALLHYQAYQQYATSPDKRVIHWISDLNRRLEKEST